MADYIDEALEETEVKITSPNANHLDTIYSKWKSNHYSPLFVCEVQKEQKLKSINESVYLNTVYHDVFDEIGDTIVVYGWSMGEQDDHVLERLKRSYEKKPFKKIAISVFSDSNKEVYMEDVVQKIQDRISSEFEIEFYDSKSQNCWNN